MERSICLFFTKVCYAFLTCSKKKKKIQQLANSFTIPHYLIFCLRKDKLTVPKLFYYIRVFSFFSCFVMMSMKKMSI